MKSLVLSIISTGWFLPATAFALTTPPGAWEPTVILTADSVPLRIGLIERVGPQWTFQSLFSDADKRCQQRMFLKAPGEITRRERLTKRAARCSVALDTAMEAMDASTEGAILLGQGVRPTMSEPITQQTEAWRHSWETGAFDSYSEYYAAHAIQVPGPKNWLQNKRILMKTRREGVRIQTSRPRLFESDKEIYAVFVQDYQANRHRDVGLKILILDRLSSKILAEKWAPLKPESPWRAELTSGAASISSNLPVPSIAPGPSVVERSAAEANPVPEPTPVDNSLYSQEIQFLPSETLTRTSLAD